MASPMYSMKPFNISEQDIELPECMYKMNPIATSDFLNGQSEPIPQEIQDLLRRQDALISRLESLKIEVDGMTAAQPQGGQADSNLPQDIVISCDPSLLPIGIIYLLTKLRERQQAILTCYHHSSVDTQPQIDLHSNGFLSNIRGVSRRNCSSIVTWIWKKCGGCELMICPIRQTKIMGEVNVCRYLMRLLGEYPHEAAPALLYDHWLDMASLTANGNHESRAQVVALLAKYLSKNASLVGNSINSVDIIMYACLKRNMKGNKNMDKGVVGQWMAACSQLLHYTFV